VVVNEPMLSRTNLDVRSDFSLVALTMLSGFIGVNAAKLDDEWYSAPPMFVAMFSLVALYRSIIEHNEISIASLSRLALFSLIAWLAIAYLLTNIWLSAGIIFSWVISSVLFQVRDSK
jgi:hypothetical protein